jgi:dipeptidyl aminopeptidase/acylaminoacyl peptidase
VGGCALNPDKTAVAYAVITPHEESNSYRGCIKTVSLSAGETSSFTPGVARDQAPQWSVDGSKLFFLSDRSGSNQVWRLDVAGGEPVPLPAVPGNVSEFAVSPDGSRLAVVSTPTTNRDEIERRGWRRITRLRFRADGAGFLDDLPQLWLIDLAAASAHQVTDGSGFVGGPAWDPSGLRLAFSGEHSPDADSLWRRELWTASDANAWQARKILEFGSAAEAPAWSADGTRIAFCGIEEANGASGLRNIRLFVADRDGRNISCLTGDEEWTCGNFVLTDSGAVGGLLPPCWLSDKELAVVGSSHGAARVFRISAGSRAVPITPATSSVTQFAMLDRETAVCCALGQSSPPEIYAARGGVEARRLTNEAATWFAGIGLAEPKPFRVAGKDGPIDAWYLAGDGPRPRASILQIHGGPHFAYGHALIFEFLLLAAAGFDVVFCNPRGSQSYGEDFASAIKGDWAAPAYDDCMAALDQAIDQFGTDAQRVGVAGGSYGGYLTLWTIAHTSRFSAAIAMRPAGNLTSLWGTSEVGRMLAEDFGGRPADVPEIYRRDSPLTYADAIATPLLIIGGENDYRTPIEQSEQVFTALRQRGATVEIMRFLQADHNLSRNGAPRQRVANLEAIVAWFDRFLKPSTSLQP